MYFILFHTMINGIMSLLSLSGSLLLVHRNATDFCMLILYSTTLPNSLMSCSGFVVVFLGFSMYNIMPSMVTVLRLPFKIWILFISVFSF